MNQEGMKRLSIVLGVCGTIPGFLLTALLVADKIQNDSIPGYDWIVIYFSMVFMPLGFGIAYYIVHGITWVVKGFTEKKA